MTSRLTVSPRARDDLRALWDYIAVQQQSPRAADQLLDRLRDAFALLATQPMLGQTRSDLGRGMRAFVVERYVIIYALGSQYVEIVRVVHSAREVAVLFRNEPPAE